MKEIENNKKRFFNTFNFKFFPIHLMNAKKVEKINENNDLQRKFEVDQKEYKQRLI